jgi:hypothetical protein
MPPHYALFGSIIAGAAGAVILAIVTITHGLRRRETATPLADLDRRQRLLRLADTAAVVCFAVAAGLGAVGLMHQARAVPPAVAAMEDGVLIERVQALEKRLAGAELDLQARGGMLPTEWRAWEDRIARLESRLGAMEDRVAVAERRDERPRPAPASTARKVVPPAPSKSGPAPPVPAPPSASPRLVPEAVVPADAALSSSSAVSAPIIAPAPPAPREPVHARVEPSAPAERSAQDPSLAGKLRRDWDEIKRQVHRSGDDWREGWDQVKRLFHP